MQTIAGPFAVWRRGDPLVWFARCLLPHLLPIAGIDAPPLFPPCPGGGVVCGKIGGPLRCLMAFIDLHQTLQLPFTLCYAVQAFWIASVSAEAVIVKWYYSVPWMQKHMFFFMQG